MGPTQKAAARRLTQERVDSKDLYGRWKIHLMDSCLRGRRDLLLRKLTFFFPNQTRLLKTIANYLKGKFDCLVYEMLHYEDLALLETKLFHHYEILSRFV